jgi:hypothetical protein
VVEVGPSTTLRPPISPAPGSLSRWPPRGTFAEVPWGCTPAALHKLKNEPPHHQWRRDLVGGAVRWRSLIPVVRAMAIDAEPLLKSPATADEHGNEGSTGVAGQERHVSGDDLHEVAALAAAQIQRLARGVAARARVRQVRLARDEVCAPSTHGLLYPRNPTRATEDLNGERCSPCFFAGMAADKLPAGSQDGKSRGGFRRGRVAHARSRPSQQQRRRAVAKRRRGTRLFRGTPRACPLSNALVCARTFVELTQVGDMQNPYA